MSAAKAKTATTKPKPKQKATKKSSVKAVAAGAARGAATGAAKGAAKSAAKASSKAMAAGGERLGRGTRWTEEQVRLLMETVDVSSTAKEAFELVARELGKSTGTVAQKYYNIQKANGGGRGARRGRSKSGAAGGAARLTSAADLRLLSVDELVTLTNRVRDEVERRRDELDAASKMLPG